MPDGKLSVIRSSSYGCVIEWTMKFDMHEAFDIGYPSPSFSFEGESWSLVIWPNGSYLDIKGFTLLRLCRKFSNRPPMKIEFCFALKRVNGVRSYEVRRTEVFEAGSCHTEHVVNMSRITKESLSEILPSGFLTVTCTLKKISTQSERVAAKEECTYCEKTFDPESISLHEKKCRIKCPECSDILLLQNWNDHECEISRSEDFRSLSQDLKKVLLHGTNYDVIVKVGNREFKAHQDILKARSKVFEAMLSHDTQEKKSGIIDVPDCDPETMEQFLSYVYCDKLEKLDETNMFELFYIADKYEMEDLKRKCCRFIKLCLSPTNICKIIQVAMKHSDSTLLNFAIEYFTHHMLDIFPTVEWQNFMKDNSTIANEILIKCHQKK